MQHHFSPGYHIKRPELPERCFQTQNNTENFSIIRHSTNDKNNLISNYLKIQPYLKLSSFYAQNSAF